MCFVFAKEKQEAADGPLQQGPAAVQDSGTGGQESQEGNEKHGVLLKHSNKQPSEAATHRWLLCFVGFGQALMFWGAVTHVSSAELLHLSQHSRSVCPGFVHVTRIGGWEPSRVSGPQQPLRLGDALSSAPCRRMTSVTQKCVASKPKLIFCLIHQVPDAPVPRKLPTDLNLCTGGSPLVSG